VTRGHARHAAGVQRISREHLERLPPVSERPGPPCERVAEADRWRRRRWVLLVAGLVVFGAGIALEFLVRPLAGVLLIAAGLVVARRGERALARAEHLLAPKRTGCVDGPGPGPNADAMYGAGNHGHFSG